MSESEEAKHILPAESAAFKNAAFERAGFLRGIAFALRAVDGTAALYKDPGFYADGARATLKRVREGLEQLREIETTSASIQQPVPLPPRTDGIPEIISQVPAPATGATGQTGDSVNHPSHYTSHPSGVECVDIAEHYGFCLGNALKYIWRAGLKSKDPTEDIKKAIWYLQRELTRLGVKDKRQ